MVGHYQRGPGVSVLSPVQKSSTLWFRVGFSLVPSDFYQLGPVFLLIHWLKDSPPHGWYKAFHIIVLECRSLQESLCFPKPRLRETDSLVISVGP